MQKDSYSQVVGYHRAIVHFDGDAFFASVEQAMDYRLRGKPIVTGVERGAATSISYQAKAFGVSRGMSLGEIRIRCPEVIFVESDYTSYAIFANRMYSIVRSYTPIVEEYSIDECFADITGLDRQFGISYEQIALRIKGELEDSLGITFGVGLAPTKTLAKAASKANKPAGFTSVPSEEIHDFLASRSVHSIWGLGGVSGTRLERLGAATAEEFAQKDDAWLSQHKFGKAYRDVWLELNGHYIYKLNGRSGNAIGSLMTTRMFKPPSSDRAFVFSQLSKNVEHVCEKARHNGVKAKGLSFYLKTQEFTYHGVSMELAIPTANPDEILQMIEERFDEVFASGVLYRATSITLRSLVSDNAFIPDLFGETIRTEQSARLFNTVDGLNKRFGKQTVFLASSFSALSQRQASDARKLSVRGRGAARPRLSLGLEQQKKTLRVPYLGVAR